MFLYAGLANRKGNPMDNWFEIIQELAEYVKELNEWTEKENRIKQWFYFPDNTYAKWMSN